MKPRDLFEMLVGAGLGAVAMYLLDPDQGHKRRHHLRDRTYDALATGGAAASAAWESARDSAHHAGQRIGSKFQELRDLDLREQVRHLGLVRPRHEETTFSGLSLISATLGAAALGAGIMFLLDPAQGALRRGLMKTRAGRMAHKARGFVQNPLGRSGHDADAGRAGSSEPSTFEAGGSDEAIAARVRQEVAASCSRPMDVYVTCRAGLVSLSGSLPLEEQDPVIERIRTIEGVVRVDNNLTTPNPIGTGIGDL